MERVKAWDTVVIGSGAGGLTAAVALARAGQKVLVLEQHYLPGGFTHSFTLGGYRFSPGIHYIGDLGPKGQLRSMLDGLGVSGALQFDELNPDGFDHFIIAGQRFDQPKGVDRWIARLSEQFPDEREGIASYFRALQTVAEQLQSMGQPSFSDVVALPFRVPQLLRTLKSLIDASVRDPLLRAVLAGQAGNHGLPPSRVPVAVHAMMSAHYFDGAWYPRGGAKSLPRAFIEQLRHHGGNIRMRARVKRIVVERGEAVGVELEGGERIAAGDVIANADPAIVYTQLLEERWCRPQRRKLQRTEYSTPMYSAFCAVDLPLEELGYDSGNYWWYRNADLSGLYERALAQQPGKELDVLFLSISSLKDRSHAPANGHHTIELLTLAPWQDLKRDEGYAKHKAEMAEKLISAAERVIPGFRAGLRFFEAGTPQTSEHFCNVWRGAAYGSAKTRWQIGPFSFSQRGPVAGLHLCGASTLSHGYAGAAFSGLIAAQQVLGLKAPHEVLERQGRPALTPAPA